MMEALACLEDNFAECGVSLLHVAVGLVIYNAKNPEVSVDVSILDNSMDIAIPNQSSTTDKWWAVIQQLIIAGVDCNLNDSDGLSPIYRFAKEEMWEHCTYMVEVGASVQSLSEDQQVCLLCHVTNSLDLTFHDDDDDVHNHSALYNTIRLNNVSLVKLILSKWSIEDSNNWQRIESITEILSNVYDELKYRGVPLSKVMEFFIEGWLIGSRFFIERNDQTEKGVLASVETVRKRAAIIFDVISDMKIKYFCQHQTEVVDGEFVYNARFVAQNIHVLKRQLKSTYDKLPWEEIEFCIVNFISSHVKPRQFNIGLLLLDKGRILAHMGNFATALQNEMVKIEQKDVNSKFPKTTDQKISFRSCCMAKVSSLYPYFEDLYNDHEMIRTIFSLKRVESYIELAVGIEVNEREDVGKLVIERTLQVIGESLKNTLESPNVSDSVHKFLLSLAPRNLREIITSLRDSLSHVHTLNNKMSLEESKNLDFFVLVQNDLKKIVDAISYILYERNVDVVTRFMSKVDHCISVVEVKKVTKILQDIHFGELPFEFDNTKELDNIVALVKQVSNEVKNQSVEEIKWFNEIEHVIALQRTNLKNVKKIFSNFSSISTAFQTGHHLNTLKTLARKFTTWRMPKICPLSDIVPWLRKLFENRPENIELVTLFHAVICCIRYEGSRIKAIDEFREMLEQIDSGKNMEIVATNELEKALEVIVKSLQDSDKIAVQQVLKNKQDMHHCKCKLSSYLEHYDPSVEQECERLLAFLQVKKAWEKKFREKFYKDDFGACQKLVDNIRDEYQILLSSVKKVIENDRPQDIDKIVRDFIKSNVRNVVLTESSIAEPLHKYFYARLELLKMMIPANEEDFPLHVKAYQQDKCLQAATEMLVLELSEILENFSLFSDNTLFLDRSSPILIGKCLRNYLAHGDSLIETLPFDTSLAIISNAVRLVENRNDLLTRNSLIGQHIKNELEDLSRMTSQHNRLLSAIVQQSALFNAAQKGNVNQIVDCVKKGGDLKAHSTRGWTVLHFAASGGNRDALQYFLDHCFGILCYHELFQSLVYIAVEFGCNNILKYLEEDRKVKFHYVDIDGKSLLHRAVNYGHQHVVMMLLSKDIYDVNATCTKGMTPLHYAAMFASKEIALKLIEKGADVSVCDLYYVTPLHLAAINGNTDVVLALLQNGANVNSISARSLTPLHCAAYHGNKDAAVALIEGGAYVDALNKDRCTPLWKTVQNDHVDVVQVLLEYGANIHNPNLKCTYLQLAAVKGHTESLLVLLEYGAAIEACSEDNSFTPLTCAAENGHCNVVNTLLSKGATVNAAMKSKLTPLHVAARNGHNEVCVALIKNGATLDAKEENGLTALHMAARNGHKDVVVQFLSEGVDINSRCLDGMTPLHLASENSQLSVVRILLKSGAQINVLAENGKTPLFTAAQKGNEDVVKELLANEAFVDVPNMEDVTPLHVAAESGSKNIVSLLLESGASVNALDVNARSPLLLAAMFGHKNVVMLLLAKHATVNSISEKKCSPLYEAAKKGYKDIVIALLRAGAYIHYQENGKNSLLVATTNGHTDVVSTLLDNDAHFDCEGFEHGTPLHQAAFLGHVNMVLTLLQRGFDINGKNAHSNTPLHCAAIKGQVQVALVLLEHGGHVNEQNVYNETPLHFASDYGHYSVAVALLQNGADANVVNNDSCTPLHYAAKGGFCEIILQLLTYNGQVNVQSGIGWTPLHVAARNGHEDVCKLLLANGGNVNTQDEEGATALHHAVIHDHTEIAVLLLDSKADVNAQDSEMATPLHMAAAGNCIHAVVTLLKGGGDIDAKNTVDMTPLHCAMLDGHADVATILLAEGASINSPDKDGITPLHTASNLGHTVVVNVLLEHGAEIDATERWVCSTPLHLAAEQGHDDIVTALLTKGALIDAKNNIGMTALHYAAIRNNKATILNLLFHGAEIDSFTNGNLTPLHIAASRGCQDALNALLDKGASVRWPGLKMFTPLHQAVKSGHKDVVVTLLNHGAELEALDGDNKTALHVAAQYGQREIVVVLLERGANVSALTALNKVTPAVTAFEYNHSDIAVDLFLYERFLRGCAQIKYPVGDGERRE